MIEVATTPSRFRRYELLTRDQGAARTFYQAVLGSSFWDAGVSLAPLPEQAAARGAPNHWLGHIGASDVAGMVERIVAVGGQQLGPTRPGGGGPSSSSSSRTVLRDPFGAVLAVSAEPETSPTPVAWHMLHSEDHERAFAWYAALFGWVATELVDLGPVLGRHQRFAWDEGRPNVGSVANTARLPGVHPHWLFCFPVTDIEDACARVRAGGGEALPSSETPSGDRVVACHDPQGAAFALHQSAVD